MFTLLTELIEMLTCNSCFLFTSSFELHGEDKLLEIKLELGFHLILYWLENLGRSPCVVWHDSYFICNIHLQHVHKNSDTPPLHQLNRNTGSYLFLCYENADFMSQWGIEKSKKRDLFRSKYVNIHLPSWPWDVLLSWFLGWLRGSS